MFRLDKLAEISLRMEYYPKLRRLHQWVLRDTSTPLNLGDAASIAGLNKTYFSTYFRSRVGIGFPEWTTCLRVVRAMTILSASSASITDTAFLVGFQDLRTFQRAFKKYTGVTPSVYRRTSELHHLRTTGPGEASRKTEPGNSEYSPSPEGPENQ